MKTLDEVIKAIDFCKSGDLSKCEICPYIGTCELDYAVLSTDALYYLKEYRTLQYGYIKAMADLEDNPPLTWDELRQMEGKPVWVEGEFGRIWNYKSWVLIRTDPENGDMIICIDGHYEFAIDIDNYGDCWQAYRKERENER